MSTITDAATGEIVTMVLPASALWFRRARRSTDTRVAVAGRELALELQPVDDAELNDRISAEYLSRYSRYDYAEAITEPGTVAATLHVTDRA